jgi:uncharacterized membrane protein
VAVSEISCLVSFFLPLRGVGIGALLIWITVTLGGTVPINAAVLDWDADRPPAHWQTQVDRWERLDPVRTWAAMLAFALLLTALIPDGEQELTASTRSRLNDGAIS